MSHTEPCASAATLLGPAAFFAASSESKRSMCQYMGLDRDPSNGLLVRIEQPSFPRRSGESWVHFTGGRSTTEASVETTKARRIVRIMCLSCRLGLTPPGPTRHQCPPNECKGLPRPAGACECQDWVATSILPRRGEVIAPKDLHWQSAGRIP